MDTKKAGNIRKNRVILGCVIDGKQCIALRGHNQNINPDNFLSLLKLIGKYNETLQKHLDSPKMKNVMYMSPQIQNELLDIMAQTYFLASQRKSRKLISSVF